MSGLARAAALQSLRSEASPSGPLTIAIRLQYDLPNASPLSDRDARRLSHDDLRDLDTEALTCEAWRLRLVLALGDLSRPTWARGWLETRLRLCKLRLRQSGGAL